MMASEPISDLNEEDETALEDDAAIIEETTEPVINDIADE